MEKEGFSFIITGEVLNQRPKSQTFKALKIIEKETGLEGLILRPLSAQFLPITIPEKEGWVIGKNFFQ
jgi:tRNA-specific 2-thiouridylase